MTQFYIGCKQVQACEQEINGQLGYAVKYPDGCISWSPKETFEKDYLLQGENGNRVTQEMVDDFIVSHRATRMANHTVVIAILRNGFSLIAESACVDPANYDESIGEKYALEKIKKQIWHLLGFMLASARNGFSAS